MNYNTYRVKAVVKISPFATTIPDYSYRVSTLAGCELYIHGCGLIHRRCPDVRRDQAKSGMIWREFTVVCRLKKRIAIEIEFLVGDI